MQPNNVLDFRRLGYYFRQHMVASFRPYLLSTLSIFGLLLILPSLVILSNNSRIDLSDIVAFYYIGLFVGGLWFTSMAFSEFNNKEKAVSFLMLPASMFEKFITAFLVTTVGFLLVYHLCAYTAFIIVNKIAVAKTGFPIVIDWDFFSKDNGQLYIYFTYIFLHGVFLVGALYFNKQAFIKTQVVLLVTLLFIYLINCLFVLLLFGNNMRYPFEQLPFVLVATRSAINGSSLYVISEPMIRSYIFIAQYLLAPILWTIAYFRLKDKEI